MWTTRRHILALAGSGFFWRAAAHAAPATGFDVDRLLEICPGRRTGFRRYVASATVTFLSIPLVSKASVGSGYALIEESDHTLAIQFGAGSYPDNARGLNRLGFIQEAIVEESAGQPIECAWLAFMTTSKESNLDQAKKALESSGTVVPYSASQGYGRHGRFTSRVDRLDFPSRYTWRDITLLVEKARASITPGTGEELQKSAATPDRPATFLYQVHRAMIDPRQRSARWLVFNGKQFQLDAQKVKDEEATEHFRKLKLASDAAPVMRMDALLTERRTGDKTPFRIWYEAGSEQTPPLRFEYQARSFLRLAFEATDAAGTTPTIRFPLKTIRENA